MSSKALCAMLLGLTILLGAGQAAQAQQAQPVKVTQPDAISLRLRIDNPTPQQCQVRVVQLSTGKSLFRETCQTATYGHRFDFQNLPSGRYALVARIGADHYRYTVQVQNKAPEPIRIAIRQVSTRQAVDSRPIEGALASSDL